MKIIQKRTSEGYLFQAGYGKGSGHHHLHLAETQRQAEESKRFRVEERAGFRCALTQGCWPGGAGGLLTTRGILCGCLGVSLHLFPVGLELEVGEKIREAVSY